METGSHAKKALYHRTDHQQTEEAEVLVGQGRTIAEAC